MKHLKRLAVFALPIVLALSGPTPVKAAPAHYTTSQVLAMFQLAEYPALPSYVTNTIGNRGGTGSVAIGVFPRGSSATYTHLVRPDGYSHRDLGWNAVGGWYTGPGYCTYQLRSDNKGQTWDWQKPDLGEGRHAIGATTSYIVSAYRQNADGSCRN